MKPNRYWYSKLTLIEKLEWRSAMREIGNDQKRYLEKKSFNFYNFIDSSFSWVSTEKGYDYWKNIAYSERSDDKFSNIMFNKITFNNGVNKQRLLLSNA